jgi:hypothetical protein
MSKQEAAVLIECGRYWLSNVWIKGDAQERDNLVNKMNNDLSGLNIRVGRGWRATDPIVKVDNKAHTYEALATWATSQADGGVAAARLFQQWCTSDTVGLVHLPSHLRALAVITHFAEVGRGYSNAVAVDLHDWIGSIASAPDAGTARARWRSYKDAFAPSLKYDEDAKQEYSG